MSRDEILEFMAEALSVNALDAFTQGIEDPNFDPERPYRGKIKWEDLPDMTRMVIELNEHVHGLTHRRVDVPIITTSIDVTTGP